MKHLMPLRFLLMLSAITVVLTLSACGSKTEPTQGSNTSQEPASNQEKVPKPVEPVKEKATIKVYVAANDELSSLKELQVDIAYANGEEKIQEAFKALQKDGPNAQMSLWKNAQLLHVKVEGEAVIIDVHLPDEARLGAPGEELAMESIQKTMFQFKDVTSLDILVDGEQVESLMGHDELEHPMKKSTAQ